MPSTRPLRIVHYLPAVRMADGGIVRAVLDLCGALARRGHRVTLAAFDAADAPEGLDTMVLAGRPMAGGLLPAAALARLQQALAGADFLHLHGPWDMAHVQLAKAARLAGVPYGVTVHGMLDDWSMAQKEMKKRLYLALFGRRFLRGAAWVHCTAQGEAIQVRRRVPGGRVVVAPLVFDTAPFAELPPRPEPSDLPKVLFLSRIHPKKGLEKLILACGELGRAGRPVALGVAGAGDSSYLETLAYLAMKEGVEAEFLGMVTGAEKIRVLRGADVFALPTSQENFGLALVEAMACSAPVITTDGVDIWPELREAGAEILPVGAGASAWAAAIAADLDAPGRMVRAERGRAWVMRDLASGKVVGAYESLYAAGHP